MPNSFSSDPDKTAASGREAHMTAISDEELDLVAGGRQFVFRGEGFQRDSWFVTFMTKLMIQGNLRQALSRPLDANAQELTVEGRRYSVWQIGETVYVEEVR